MYTRRDIVGAERNLTQAVEGDGHPVFGAMGETQAALKGVQVLFRLYGRLEYEQELLREKLERGESGQSLTDEDWVRMRKAADQIKLLQEILGD